MCCYSTTSLIEKGKVTSLSFKEIISLRSHLLMCPPCSKYNKLSKQLDQFFEASTAEVSDVELLKEHSLSEEKKQAILNVIKDFES